MCLYTFKFSLMKDFNSVFDVHILLAPIHRLTQKAVSFQFSKSSINYKMDYGCVNTNDAKIAISLLLLGYALKSYGRKENRTRRVWVNHG